MIFSLLNYPIMFKLIRTPYICWIFAYSTFINRFKLLFFGLFAGCLYKKRPVDDDPVFVDEDPPTIYFDPNDPTIGTLTYKYNSRNIIPRIISNKY